MSTVTDLDQLELKELEQMAADIDPSTQTVSLDNGGDLKPHNGDDELKGALMLVQATVYGFMPDWKVTNEEMERMADAYIPVINQYFPNAMDYLGTGVNALFVTAITIGPRIAQTIQAKRAKQQEGLQHEPAISED